MVLNKRIIRELRENIARYLGLITLVLISSMLIVGYANSSDCVMLTGEKVAFENTLEDGEFYVDNELTNMTIDKIKNLGVTLEENFYVDYEIYENQIIRIFKERKNINRVSIVEGENLYKENEIVIDEHFGKDNKYNLNNSLIIDNQDFKIVGYGAAPDYVKIIQKFSDVTVDTKHFGIAFVSNTNFEKLKNKCYSYVFKLNGVSADKLKKIVAENSSMTGFVKIDNNGRAIGYIDNCKSNKSMAIVIGVILFIICGFMISMSIINSIDQESPIIGALYSLGYVKKEILKHFMILPISVVSLGATVGTYLGFVIAEPLTKTITRTYSLPNIQKVYSPYLIFVGIIMPILLVVVINYIATSKKLSSTPLQLLRREKKSSKINTIKINYFDFVTKFRLREFLREIKGNIILFFGIFLSTFLVVFGVCINSALEYNKENNKRDITYNYMYVLNLPIEVTENKDVEKMTLKSVSIYSKDLHRDMDITLEGIAENSNFYSFSIPEDEPGLYISDSVKHKYNLNIGDTVYLKDKGENRVFKLKIKDVVDYKAGLNVFMNRTQLNSLLKKSKDYFNGYLSNKELKINEDYISSETTAKNINKSSEIMMSRMRPTVIILIVSSCVLFFISMYLLLKLMIDKSISSISLVKIFGFNQKEINKLYLGSSLYMVLISAAISIPITVILTRMLYPGITANVQAFLYIQPEFRHYLFIFAVIIISYVLSNILLKIYINKVSLSEALKNRD